jgi:hypothetical protein
MKNLITLAFFFICLSVFATDRVVQQGGPIGTYSSVGAAVTDAVDGDQIIINNRIDLLPWVENITVNKSLTFLSAVDNAPFWVEGSYTVVLAEGRKVTIVGMRNTGGNFNSSGSAPVSKTEINIFQSDINGNISFTSGGTKLYLGNTKARAVSYTYGNIIGNDLQSVNCFTDPVATTDFNLVVGNRVGYVYSPSGNSYTHSNSSQYLYFSNNFIYNGSNSHALQITDLKSGTETNRILNCTLLQGYSTTTLASGGKNALRLSFSTGTLTVENSSMGGTYNAASYGSNGIYISNNTELTTFYYNFYYNPYSTSATYPTGSLGNNSTSASTTSIEDDGSSSSASFVNAGSPLNEFVDLDLTRNDIGCFGGSYSMQNFLPLDNTQSSRVNYVSTPRVVYLGGTVNVSAIGVDE